MINVFRLAIVLICFISCSNSDEKAKAATPPPVDSTIRQVVDTIGTLSDADLNTIIIHAKTFFDKVLPPNVFNGSILVAKKGTIVFEENAGFTDPKLKRDTINSKTSFHLASITKTFTAMSILKLREEGNLDWKTRSQNILKTFRTKALP